MSIRSDACSTTSVAKPRWWWSPLTDEALDRAREIAQQRYGTKDNETVAHLLGYSSTMALWRANKGRYDTPIHQAQRICADLDMAFGDVFGDPPGPTRPIRRDPATRRYVTTGRAA